MTIEEINIGGGLLNKNKPGHSHNQSFYWTWFLLSGCNSGENASSLSFMWKLERRRFWMRELSFSHSSLFRRRSCNELLLHESPPYFFLHHPALLLQPHLQPPDVSDGLEDDLQRSGLTRLVQRGKEMFEGRELLLDHETATKPVPAVAAVADEVVLLLPIGLQVHRGRAGRDVWLCADNHSSVFHSVYSTVVFSLLGSDWYCLASSFIPSLLYPRPFVVRRRRPSSVDPSPLCVLLLSLSLPL